MRVVPESPSQALTQFPFPTMSLHSAPLDRRHGTEDAEALARRSCRCRLVCNGREDLELEALLRRRGRTERASGCIQRAHCLSLDHQEARVLSPLLPPPCT